MRHKVESPIAEGEVLVLICWNIAVQIEGVSATITMQVLKLLWRKTRMGWKLRQD